MDKVKHTRLKVTGTHIDCGGGIHRYDFVISPLVPDSPIFRFMRYCVECDLDKTYLNHTRKEIAADLRKKHQQTWQRYHAWKENR